MNRTQSFLVFSSLNSKSFVQRSKFLIFLKNTSHLCFTTKFYSVRIGCGPRKIDDPSNLQPFSLSIKTDNLQSLNRYKDKTIFTVSVRSRRFLSKFKRLQWSSPSCESGVAEAVEKGFFSSAVFQFANIELILYRLLLILKIFCPWSIIFYCLVETWSLSASFKGCSFSVDRWKSS